MHTNQKLLVDLLVASGATYRTIDEYEELLEVTFKDKKDFLLDRFSSVVPFHVVKMTADKMFTKKTLIENNINTPKGKIFTSNTYSAAIKYAEQNYPVVIKPNWGSHGDFVMVDINSNAELEKSLSIFYSENNPNTPFIIEKFFPWKEYRLFITELEDFAVIHREWSYVVGNGINTIEELIKIENLHRKKLKETINTSLCSIVIDNEVIKFLLKQNLNLSSVPNNNIKIYLRQESNLAKGGVSINLTKEFPKHFKDLAIKIVKCFPGLKVAGLDMLCDNIYDKNPKYVILEVNSNPGLTMHHYPAIGEPENVAQYVLNIMFPGWFNV